MSSTKRYPAKSREKRYTSYSKSGQSFVVTSGDEKDDSIGHFIGEEGMTLNSRYEIIRELGTGTFAKAYEVYDEQTKKHYAIKIVRAVERYCRHAKIESQIVMDLTKRDPEHLHHCSHLYDAFEHEGHYCMVLDLLGKSLYDTVKMNDYQPFPLACIRVIMQQLFECLQFLHAINLTHTDLKLENLLFETSSPTQHYTNASHQTLILPQDLHIAVIDFGSATYASEYRKGTINTRQYRAPEVLLRLPWDEASDIWGAACIAMELFTGDLLFQTHDDLLHFALIEKIVGKIPGAMLKRSSSHKADYFDVNGSFKLEELHYTERDHVANQLPLKEMIGDHYPCFYDLMSRCLMISPNRRMTASEALLHPFFTGKD